MTDQQPRQIQGGPNNWNSFPPSDFKTPAYGPSGLGFPSKAVSRAIHGGTRFFYAGLYDSTYGTCGDVQQQWKLRGIGGAIDGGHVKVKLKGYAGTNGSPLITAHTDLYFRDGQNHTVAKNSITRAVSGSIEQYLLKKGATQLPAHTRIMRLHLWADGDGTVSSGDCQAFWDNLRWPTDDDLRPPLGWGLFVATSGDFYLAIDSRPGL